MAQASGAPLVHVPYRGGARAVGDLRGGSLPSLSAPLGIFLPHMASGQIRLLAVSGEARSALATVPTWRELGFRLTAREWYGFCAGPHPREVVARSAAALLKSLDSPEAGALLARFGLELTPPAPSVWCPDPGRRCRVARPHPTHRLHR